MALPVGTKGWTRLIPCRCAYRTDEERRDSPAIAAFQEWAEIPPGYQEASFAAFDPSPDSSALDAARRFAVNLDLSSGRPLLVLASTKKGNGKTTLACAILRALWEKSEKAGRFYVVPELLRRYRVSFNEGATETTAQIDSELRTTALIVLDDLGAEKESEWTRDSLYAILNYRYNHRLATVVTTNQGEDTMDGRILSRLQDKAVSAWVTLRGPDRRQQA